MTRLQQVQSTDAAGRTAKLFDGIQKKLGSVPNMMRAMGNSPAALGAYLSLSNELSKGSLTAPQREQIALAVGQANGCNYCLSAHSALGKMAGLTTDQIRDARLASAVDSKDDALLRFALKLVTNQGHVADSDLQSLHDHGFTDGDIVEVVAHVALNIFTNYFNHVADPEIDFPRAASLETAA
ncbi:Alkyl hydroperoxide reductase AhpD [Polystyrenella longa]|uniref:Alkyl hydroperoxide reductase AhpD n=1 Tax=Polystyrenella longa TaxID=2528007 RepID=A0A518CTQ6_9PLAN|nr:peroxidase-related enzyme [Polystyrenella longa]QDU82600.1 Alkyl hydroperoxide reductase AhpD [Polystyrenella longa]